MAAAKALVLLIFVAVPFALADRCDPLFRDEQAKEDFNKRTILNYYREGFTNPQNFPEAARKYVVAKGYIQHGPDVADGRQAMIEATMTTIGTSTKNPVLYLGNIAADGDLVWVHHLDEEPQTGQKNVIMSIFRLECGLAVEHWEVYQAVDPNAVYANSHPFF